MPKRYCSREKATLRLGSALRCQFYLNDVVFDDGFSAVAIDFAEENERRAFEVERFDAVG